MARKGNRGSRNKSKAPPSTQQVSKADVGTPLDEETAAKVKAELDQERSALDGLREELEQYRIQLVADNDALEETTTRVEERRAAVTHEERSHQSARQELQQAQSNLAERERGILQREAEADSGFARRNEEALASLTGRLDELRAAIDAAEGDVSTRRLVAHAALEQEMQRERDARTNALEAETGSRRAQLEKELATLRTDTLASLEGAKKEQVAAAETQKKERETAVAGLAKEREQLDGRQVKLRQQQTQLELEQQLLQADRQALDETIRRRAQDEVVSLQSQLRLKDEHLENLRKDRARLEDRLEILRAEAQQFGDKSPDEVLGELRRLRDEVDRLTDELTERPSLEVLTQLETLQTERQGWERTRSELQREVGRLKGERHTWLLEQAELERQRDLAEAAHRMREALLAESERLEAEVVRLRGLYETPKEKEARIGVIEEAWFGEDAVSRGPEVQDELAWLAGINEQCAKVGMVFPPRLLEAFHTSLKCAEWSALTVLAGVSGTGKSEMPRLYARFGGLAYLPLAVEPNWDSPQSLLGFFNSIDNRFNAKPLLRALVQSQMEPRDRDYNGGLRDRVLLVLLDEMNLAHVELYFSDLLSKLEDRRGKAEGDTWIDVDLGAGLDPYKLHLGRNVLWTGTMNEDATTKSLSDKVLDRSNLLVFPRPRAFTRRRRVELPDPAPLLPRSTWDGWIDAGPTLDERQVAPFKGWLEQVNQRLEYVGRALGHRVWQSIEAYMCTHPRVIVANGAEDKEAFERGLKLAFEDAVVQKVMPKLRGIETSGKSGRECLEPIQKLLEEDDVGLQLADDFQHARTVGQGAFVWSSARYLELGE